MCFDKEYEQTEYHHDYGDKNTCSYIDGILSKVDCKSFSLNAELRTKSKDLSEILSILFEKLSSPISISSDKEFYAHITEDGQTTLYTGQGEKIEQSIFYGIVATIMIKKFHIHSVVLPRNISENTKFYIGSIGGKIIYSDTSDRDIANKIIMNNLTEEINLIFDGVYLSIMLLDYLNFNKISFSELIEKINSPDRCEFTLSCPPSDMDEIMINLTKKYKFQNPGENNLKIYSGNGWIFIIPKSTKHSITILSDTQNTEAAEEISGMLSNEIKNLQKSNK